jgi:hypothetical protein
VICRTQNAASQFDLDHHATEGALDFLCTIRKPGAAHCWCNIAITLIIVAATPGLIRLK